MAARTHFLIDIGNTSLKYCSFFATACHGPIRSIPTSALTASVLHEAFSNAYCTIASVVPWVDALFEANAQIQSHFITHRTIPTLQLALPQPAECGADRLVNALAAYDRFKTACLIIDSGTALTGCVVNKQGVYLGGAIFPGMKLCSEVLSEKTAKIPLIWVEETAQFYGNTTKMAVQSGLYEGFLAIMQRLIRRFKAQEPQGYVVGTGSGLAVFKDHLLLDDYDEALVFKGLALCHTLGTS